MRNETQICHYKLRNTNARTNTKAAISSLHLFCFQPLLVRSLQLLLLLLVVQHLRKLLLALDVPRRDRLASLLARRWELQINTIVDPGA